MNQTACLAAPGGVPIDVAGHRAAPSRGWSVPGGWQPGRQGLAWRWGLIAAAHAALAMAAWQVALRVDVLPPPVLQVAIVDVAPPPVATVELPRPAPPRWQPVALPTPEVTLAPEPMRPTAVAVAPLPVVPVQPPPPEAPRVAVAAAPPPPPPPPPAPAAPVQLPSSAIAYLQPPPVEVPLASRRLREEGTVWLRVRVGADGTPREVTLHRSSGHARLDEQALWAMRRARFKPQVQAGAAIEWIVIAPLQYEVS